MTARRRRAATKRKPKATPAAPPAATPSDFTALARLALLLFALFLETQDPEKLAGEVTEVDVTLCYSARIQLFFRRYSAALRARKATR